MPTTTKFGISQLANETPQIAKVIAQTTIYLVVAVNLALLYFPQIPSPTKVTIAGYANGALGLVNTLCHMFGIEVTNPTYTQPKQ